VKSGSDLQVMDSYLGEVFLVNGKWYCTVLVFEVLQAEEGSVQIIRWQVQTRKIADHSWFGPPVWLGRRPNVPIMIKDYPVGSGSISSPVLQLS
jgi:hypothetical protein